MQRARRAARQGTRPTNWRPQQTGAQSSTPLSSLPLPLSPCSGLDFPTSVTSALGRVYISEKAGIIRVASSWSAPTTTVWLDIRLQTASFQLGDLSELGLSSIAASLDGSFIYGVFSVWDAANADRDCSGTQAQGVPSSSIRGCPTRGRLSRWAIMANGSAGGEEVLLSDASNKMCSQFLTLGADNVEVAADGAVLVSVGVGANENSATGEDHGQFGVATGSSGRDACTNSSGGWGGAFRAQLVGTWGGKIVRVAASNASNVTVLAQGLHNPWRFAMVGSSLFVTDTATGRGMYGEEEVNGPVPLAATGAVPNFGFPCWSGSTRNEAYTNLSSPLCNTTAALNGTLPWYSYTPASFNRSTASISALAASADGGRLYIGEWWWERKIL